MLLRLNLFLLQHFDGEFSSRLNLGSSVNDSKRTCTNLAANIEVRQLRRRLGLVFIICSDAFSWRAHIWAYRVRYWLHRQNCISRVSAHFQFVYRLSILTHWQFHCFKHGCSGEALRSHMSEFICLCHRLHLSLTVKIVLDSHFLKFKSWKLVL